jgi:hypothetical protein
MDHPIQIAGQKEKRPANQQEYDDDKKQEEFFHAPLLPLGRRKNQHIDVQAQQPQDCPEIHKRCLTQSSIRTVQIIYIGIDIGITIAIEPEFPRFPKAEVWLNPIFTEI